MTHPALSALADVLAAKDREIADLRDALAWYAEPSNHRRHVVNLGPRKTWTNSPAAFDRGARAKFMLLMIGGGA